MGNKKVIELHHGERSESLLAGILEHEHSRTIKLEIMNWD